MIVYRCELLLRDAFQTKRLDGIRGEISTESLGSLELHKIKTWLALAIYILRERLHDAPSYEDENDYLVRLINSATREEAMQIASDFYASYPDKRSV